MGNGIEDSARPRSPTPDGIFTPSQLSRFPSPLSLLQNCPIPVQEVIDMDIERFNDVCVRFGLSEKEIARMRDVRTKGKNRQAARKSRAMMRLLGHH